MLRLTVVAFLFMVFSVIHAQNNRIEYNGDQLFLSGANIAWVNFAYDIGPGETNFERFGEIFKETHDFGANSQRFWLHTNGTSTPEFDTDSLVIGPGAGAIEDLTRILDSAYAYDVGLILCLWSFDMLRLEIGEPYLSRNRKILEEEEALNAYIQNALIPMVDSLKEHPGIIAWEVFNEPEGMIPDAFWGGWSGIGHVSREDVQRVVNRVAGAIHDVDPGLKVTSGVHNMHSLTDVDGGDQNFYADTALVNAGGVTNGTLDFYQVHHYDFPLNPFDHHFDHWNLDKPLLIGEFHPGCSDCGEFSNYETLIDSGYAGAMGWMWLDSYGESIRQECQYLFKERTSDVDIDNMLGDTPYLTFSGPEINAVLESGSSVSITAEASDTDGTVEKVELFIDLEIEEDTVLNTLVSPPYDYTWESPADGVYKVYAKATDNDGYSKVSQPIPFTVGDPPIYRYEAENAELTGNLAVQNDAGASAGKYVTIEQECSILWTVYNCPADGNYDMIIGYRVPFGEKNNYFIINGDEANQLDIQFTGPDNAWLRDTVPVSLLQGENTVEMQDFWGWMQFDFIEFPFPRPPFVKEILVSTASGNDYIDTPGGTLQMTAELSPDDALQGVEWKVNRSTLAAIDETGLLTALQDGELTVTAVATDGSLTQGSMVVSITNQGLAADVNYTFGFKLYPNPVGDVIQYSSDLQVAAIEVYTSDGRLELGFSSLPQNGSLDLSALSSGLYLIVVRAEDGSLNRQLIVKE